ncbi:MAG: nucleotidyltransferase domain-containing protein [Bergeyella zoohelcum]|nr:nucleotidyltransferase domain-containing protein [Bergeyella zoohelcum]
MLSQREIDLIIETMKPYHPEKIGVFGSYSRGENKTESDIDILYQFSTPISLFEKADLLERLESKLNKSVDLVSEKYLHPFLKESIINDLKIIYDNR